MDIQTKILQFEKMAHDDPNNELGHFSLGKAYLEAGRAGDAVRALLRAIDLNPSLSKAYELASQASEAAGDRGKAVELLKRGLTVADERGDRKPREAMAAILQDWGVEVPPPPVAATPHPDAAAGDAVEGFTCSRCGSPHGKLDRPPFRGPLGQRIFDHICRSCWREWIPMGTKVINELGLQLADKRHQETYDQYMLEFLQLEQ